MTFRNLAKRLGVRRFLALFFSAFLTATVSQARLEIIPPTTDPFVFCGPSRQLDITFHNTATEDFNATINVRIFQASSSTLAPIGPEHDWKKLHILTGQKIIETTSFDFPEVRALTLFQIRWLNDRHEEIGKTTVHVLPTNVLAQISVLTSNTVVGLIDPDDKLKPALKKAAVKFHELTAENPFANFRGNLALIAPSSDPEFVNAALKSGTKHPLTILWMRDFNQRIGPVPNMYFVRAGQAQVAVVDATLFTDLEHAALAQINLLRSIKTAQHPEKLQLPSAPKP